MARKNATAEKANGTSYQLDGAVHSLEKKLEEQAELHARNPQEQKEAGLGQLVICVGGIYASLYVRHASHWPEIHTDGK
jgi:UDP-galactose transporter B1